MIMVRHPSRSPAVNDATAAIEATGLGIGWSNDDYSYGRCYRFTDPDGHAMEIYYDERKYVAPEHLRSKLHNQPMKYPGRGVGVRRSDHLALLCRDVPANRIFMQENLGCMLREQIRFENGTIEAGPSKHNNSQAFYLYSYEPGGNRVEVYTSGFQIFAPDFEPVIWTEDNRDGGVYWGQKLPESFATYATPVVDDDAAAEPAGTPAIDPQ